MHRTKVEWADRMWNPISGCLKNCSHCKCTERGGTFSGDIRFNKSMTDQYSRDGEVFILDDVFITKTGQHASRPFGFSPTFFRYRKKIIDELKTPGNVVVGYEGDMFGPWISDEMLKEVFDQAKGTQQRLLFITTFPERYEDLEKKGILPEGDQYWYGWAVTKGKTKVPEIKGHRFMVCEPLLGPVGEIPEEVEWVVLGADTKKYKDRVTPKEEWVDGIEADCEKKGIPLFMGSGIEAYASNPKKQYPEKLKTKELSSIRKGIYETDCNACGKHGMKREMCALSVQYGRGGPRYALGYLCHDCLDAWIEEYKLNDVPKQ